MKKIKTVHDLEFDKQNFNKGNEQGKSLIKKSITEHGTGRSILVDKNAKIIAGNKTTENFKELGFEKVKIVKAMPDELVVVQRDDIDLDTPQGRAMALADNKTSEANLEWDFEIMQEELPTEMLEDWGIELLEDEIEAVEDDYTEPDDMQVDVVLGDLIEIGEHRLLCGDSTDSDQVVKLMNGEKADMVFTDPPYGISIVKNEKVGADFGIAKKGKYSKVIADDTTITAKSFYNTCISLGMDKFIIWGGNYFTDFLPFSDGWLIWNKRANTEIRNTFADGEMAWCSFHTPIRIYDQLWNGMIREGEKEKRVHPTQKPIRTLSEIIQDHVKGDVIFDGFLGSGSTMVASHQLKRKCYGMELEPKYCQVIIDRMLNLDETLSIKINGKEYRKAA